MVKIGHSTPHPLYGLVLMGGFSSRMQMDKANIRYHSCSQARFSVELLKRICARVYLSCRVKQPRPTDVRSVAAIYDNPTWVGKGPISGILSAMKKFPHAAWCVLACDLPNVTPAVLEKLVNARDRRRMATAYNSPTSNLPEPLCAIYEAKAYKTIQCFLPQGIYCPRKILIHSHPKLITLDDPHALENINTKDELASYRRQRKELKP